MDEFDGAAAVFTDVRAWWSPERARHYLQLDPEAVVRCVVVDGVPAGAMTAGRLFHHGPEDDALHCEIAVAAPYRRRGIGRRLHAEAAAVARRRGKRTLSIVAGEHETAGIAFLTALGFTEHERAKALGLRLAGRAAPAIEPPPGYRITTLAAEPALERAVYEVDVEAVPDIPNADGPTIVPPYEEWRALQVGQPGFSPEMLFIAVRDDEVAGYSLIAHVPDGTVEHHMTGVRTGHRGRGVASALKRAAIAWAVTESVGELITENAEDNVAMRAINRRLGYEPRPDWIAFRCAVGS
jgi:mycothiol synthase